MMIAIINRTRDDRPPSEPHEYTVQVNNGPIIATFKHCRTLPMSECLLRAYEAVKAAEEEGTTKNPFAQETE